MSEQPDKISAMIYVYVYPRLAPEIDMDRVLMRFCDVPRGVVRWSIFHNSDSDRRILLV